jgi:methylthioribose-1-phosphate isomerase
MTASSIYPVTWQHDRVLLIDQTRLPGEFHHIQIANYHQMAEAIKTMIVRGAPAIGVAAAYGVYLGARDIYTEEVGEFLPLLENVAEELRHTRPTAVNLFWAIREMLKTAYGSGDNVATIKQQLLMTAQAIQEQDLYTCQQIGDRGLAVLPSSPDKLNILTHCNAGALATAGYGTALGVIRSAWTAGRLERVYADETRPRLQGAKLTAWECVQEKIPVTLITDNMAGHMMARGEVDAVIVGTDRVAANGDVANKIGTYMVAVLAHRHGIPFYVACPLSTIDMKIARGEDIPIEERSPLEVTGYRDCQWAADGVMVRNPSFDVTPAELVTALITEKGVIHQPDMHKLKQLFS